MPDCTAAPAPSKRRSGYRWRPDEDAVLREHYPKGGSQACLPHLALSRDKQAIQDRALILGIKAPPSRARAWTAAEDDAIRRAYAAPKGQRAIRTLPDLLGVSKQRISERAAELGVGLARSELVRWTPEETTVIEAHARKGLGNVQRALARRGYRRSLSQIRSKMTRLRLCRQPADVFSARAVAEGLGISANMVLGWIAKGWLKAERAAWFEPTEAGNVAYAIRAKDLRAFIVGHVAHLNLARVEKHWFIDVLTNRIAEG